MTCYSMGGMHRIQKVLCTMRYKFEMLHNDTILTNLTPSKDDVRHTEEDKAADS